MKNPCFGCRRTSDKIGVLIAQLGTPDEPQPRALRRYLKQFLGDPRVIEANRFLWWIILNGVILTTRPKRSARLYRRIWTDAGSPLLKITERQTELVRERIQSHHEAIEVEFGMRYGNPSLECAIDSLLDSGCTKLILFPMYPQYSATTTASTYDMVFAHLLKRRFVPTLKVVAPYYAHEQYIGALATSINDAYKGFSERPERLVLSYHGIPQKYVRRGDPYCCMCVETTRAMVPHLNLPASEVIHTFQSRFGRDPWLTPYTDETIQHLAEQGIKHIALACPGFPADCLETLDELGNEGRELFREYGGERFDLIPCLNDHPSWISAMVTMIQEELSPWLPRHGDCSSGTDSCISCPWGGDKAAEHPQEVGA